MVGYVCILLDDVQHMDPLSWQFLSSALSNKNVVLVVTMLTPASWDELTQVEVGISQDKRLAHSSLEGLGSEYLGAFACQFLNVVAIPTSLETYNQLPFTLLLFVVFYYSSWINVRAQISVP